MEQECVTWGSICLQERNFTVLRICQTALHDKPHTTAIFNKSIEQC